VSCHLSNATDLPRSRRRANRLGPDGVTWVPIQARAGGIIVGMNRTVKVAISLPEELLGQVDRVRRRRAESRSQYFRDAAAARLTLAAESSVEVYRRAYVEQPETLNEVEAANQAAAALLTLEPLE
jgi:hypothetical protein